MEKEEYGMANHFISMDRERIASMQRMDQIELNMNTLLNLPWHLLD